ncbi:hypothetical protein BDZ85DRAFT_262301 [Elsinoe ampelina]|uniref:P-loop containing nucleoside triphosphate hydrolase protein n=1 Tax=Elsinoe ampelina TaxID=302913 RepID=A0A6A6GDQ0_9PEZI|nr:hypothetical protein BDZ85DRAFT_262301 [Elsinoe ampelina]
MTRQINDLLLVGPSGSGKKTLQGCLVYKLGMDLSLLGKLEKHGAKRYEQIPPFLEAQGVEAGFETKSMVWRITDSSPCDTTLFVLDATSSPQSSAEFVESSTQLEKVNEHTACLFAVNKMDQVNWSRDMYEAHLRELSRVMKRDVMSSAVALSALEGYNILEAPPIAQAQQGGSDAKAETETLVELLDRAQVSES